MIYGSNKQLKGQIKAFIKSKGITQIHIANQLGWHKQTLNTKLSTSGQINMSLDDAKEILNAIGYDIDIQIVPHHEDDNA